MLEGTVAIVVYVISALVSLVPAAIGLGLSSYGAYSLATEGGFMANIPAVESFVRSLPF